MLSSSMNRLRCIHPFNVTWFPHVSYSAFRQYASAETVTMSSPLPPTFRSFYRLFLRATAASVLAHPDATLRLRKLWRPVFDHAAHAIRQMQDDQLPPTRRETLARWYTLWEKRMDNTVSLLYSSAISRGLPHRVTQNLHRMARATAILRDPSRPNKKPWRGHLPPDAPEYERKPVKPPTPTQTQLGIQFRTAPRTLGEIVGMAEGWGGLSLGRTRRLR
ncbi:hypothetical protein BV20DRAFT_971444 [Pilatotrama ljubarskyi]|nr:hypothetical protein BV20DRAFT_971444 [Pilatotrama ljubarskyi]